eukprot:5799442-Prymnesium_polylepis.1
MLARSRRPRDTAVGTRTPPPRASGDGDGDGGLRTIQHDLARSRTISHDLTVTRIESRCPHYPPMHQNAKNADRHVP